MFEEHRHQRYSFYDMRYLPPPSPFGFDAYARQFHNLPAAHRDQMPRASEAPRSKGSRRTVATHIPWRRG